MEKTSIERLFNADHLEKEDLNIVVRSINDIFNIITSQQKVIMDLKLIVDNLNKKTIENSSLLINISNKIDEINNSNMATIGTLNNFPYSPQGFQQFPQRQQQVVPIQNNVPMVQPKNVNGSQLNFDPMSVSVPVTNAQGDTTVKVSPQQMNLIKHQIASRQPKYNG